MILWTPADALVSVSSTMVTVGDDTFAQRRASDRVVAEFVRAGAAAARVAQANVREATVVGVEEGGRRDIEPMQHAVGVARLHQRRGHADRVVPCLPGHQQLGASLADAPDQL